MVVNGNSRKPNVQGLVEQANGTMEVRIRGWLHENQTTEWANGLLEVAWSINTLQHSVMKLCPYQLIFANRMPHLGPNSWLLCEERADTSISNEDDNPPDTERSINYQTYIERTFLEEEERNSLRGVELPGDSVHSVINTPSFSILPGVRAELDAIEAGSQHPSFQSPLQHRSLNTNEASYSQ